MPEGELKGVIQFVHGYGDYAGRYAYLAQKFSQMGYEFIAIDQRGLGHSEGRRGVYEDTKSIIDD
jgi:lysophospholipase